MNIRTRTLTAAILAASAGLAAAQPTIDGVFSSATENGFYGPIRWVNTVPTQFGDNMAGMFNGGNFGDPENVTTGVEIKIPKSALGNATTFRLGGWVTSGDRSFMSNQTIGSLPIDTSNIGGSPDFNDPVRFPGRQFIDVGAIPNATIVVDGTADAGYGAAKFVQTNYTGFGDSQAGTDIGGGGSEIDQVFVAQDATNIYIMIAGNLEANGNGLDLYIDTNGTAGGASELGNGSGSGAFIIDAPNVIFDTSASPADTFRPDFVVSVDAFDNDADGNTPNVPRAWYGVFSGNNADVDLLGNLAGYGAANAGPLTGGDSGVPAVSLAVSNVNVAGVIGSPSQATPVSPDANWAYGSELDNLRAGIVQSEVGTDYLYIFIGGNMEVNFNKLSLFIDAQPGGQNRLGFDSNGDPIDNIDISFGALQTMAGIKFDDGFEADYWFNVNNGQDGGSGNLINFTDAAVLRSDGVLLEPFTLTPLDYGAFFGGEVTNGVGDPVANPVELIDFSGPRVDIQDGFTSGLYTNYAPRQTQIDPNNPVPGLLQIAIDNSNVGGVTSSAAVDSIVRQVSTGIEICIDLDELGWDGVQDILLAGFISNGGFNFMSNQVFGDAAGPDNLGTLNEVDFSLIPGTQYVNLSAEVQAGCNAADIAEPFGILDLADITGFITAFTGAQPAADLAPPFGVFDLADITAFITAFSGGCP